MDRVEENEPPLRLLDRTAMLNKEAGTLSRVVTGLKAKVLHLTNSVSGLWGADDIEVEMKDNVEARSDAERIKCRSLLESLKCAFLAEIKAIEQDFRLQVTMQKGENLRFKQMLSNIKSEKTYITQQLLLFQRRVDRLENEIGRD